MDAFIGEMQTIKISLRYTRKWMSEAAKPPFLSMLSRGTSCSFGRVFVFPLIPGLVFLVKPSYCDGDQDRTPASLHPVLQSPVGPVWIGGLTSPASFVMMQQPIRCLCERPHKPRDVSSPHCDSAKPNGRAAELLFNLLSELIRWNVSMLT